MRIWSHKSIKFRIGLRTAKSAVAVMIAMAVVSVGILKGIRRSWKEVSYDSEE